MNWQNNCQHRTTTPVYDQDPLLHLLWTVFPSFLSFSRCCVCFFNISFFSFLRGLLSIVDCFPVKSYLLLNNFQKAKPGCCLKVSEKDFSLTGTFIVSCYWEDERIHWRPGHHLKSPHYALQKHVASKLWAPKMRASFYRSNLYWLFMIRFNMWKAARTTRAVCFSTRDSLWTTWAESFS